MKHAIMRRLQEPFALRLRHLDEIAEKVIVLELELLCSRHVAIARLQRRDHAPAFVAQRAQLVERRVISGCGQSRRRAG